MTKKQTDPATKSAPPSLDTVSEEAESPEEDSAAPSESGEEEEVVFVEDPTFEVEYKGDCAYEVKVTVPGANKKKQTEKVLEDLREKVELPGFRRGRAPLRLVERKLGKVLKSDVAEQLAAAAFKRLVKEKELKPIAAPLTEGLETVEKTSDEDPLIFTVKFEVAPRVELGKYRGIEVERPVVKVTEEDVERGVKDTQARFAVYETLKDDRAVAGDQAVIDFKGIIEGKAFDGGSAESYPYILGTKRFFPEFEEALLGSSAGDERTCEVTIPNDFPRAELRGKMATFSIRVKELKRRNVPELTEEFAKIAGYESVADLQEKVREQFGQSVEARCRQIAERRALDAIIANSRFEIPRSFVENATRTICEDEVKRLLASRIPLSEIDKHREEMMKRAEETATREIREILALNEITDAEGIEVTEEELEKGFEALSAYSGLQLDVVNEYMEREDRRSEYESRILRGKALATVMEHAQICEREVDDVAPADEADMEAS